LGEEASAANRTLIGRKRMDNATIFVADRTTHLKFVAISLLRLVWNVMVTGVFVCVLALGQGLWPSSAHAHAHAKHQSSHYKHVIDASGLHARYHGTQHNEATLSPLVGIFSPSPATTGLTSSTANKPQSGIASVYSGDQTASGQRMKAGGMTAAHRTLPFGTSVTVVNSQNGLAVVVRITDRGPFVHGRVIDLSPTAARAIGISGLARVSLTH
jgi:rare lipoprotein A